MKKKKFANEFKHLILEMSTIQRISFLIIAVTVITGIFAVIYLSIKENSYDVRVFNAPIRDEIILEQIVQRIKTEQINIKSTSDGIIVVSDKQTARRIRAILIREDLIPITAFRQGGINEEQ